MSDIGVLYQNLPDDTFLQEAIRMSLLPMDKVLVMGDKKFTKLATKYVAQNLSKTNKLFIYTPFKSLLKAFYTRSYAKLILALSEVPTAKEISSYTSILKIQEPGTICTLVCPSPFLEIILKSVFGARYLVGHTILHNWSFAIVIAVRY